MENHTIKVLFSNIKWDTDGKNVKDLPSSVELTVDAKMDVGYEGADVLSNKYGWCVESFNFQVLGLVPIGHRSPESALGT